MSIKAWPVKDPDEVLDYEADWTKRLNGDTIETSTWTVPAGLTKVSDSVTAGKFTHIWLSGGVLAKNYKLLNRVVTAGGRTMDQTIEIRIGPK